MTDTLIDDEPDPMTINCRVRCVVQMQTHDVIVYGLTTQEYSGSLGHARDVRDRFDHSAGRGKHPGSGAVLVVTQKHFFTPGIGRAEEILLRRKLARS